MSFSAWYKYHLLFSKCTLLVAFIFVCGSCSHPQKSFERELNAKNCDEALDNVPELDPTVKLIKETETTARRFMSYTYVGASYTAEVIWDAVAGTVTTVAMCSPAILMSLNKNSGSSSSGSSPCFPIKSIDGVLAPPLGRRAYKDTKDMRCPDLSGLIHSLRGVSACFEAKGSRADLAKAQSSLKLIQSSDGFYSCFTSDEKELLISDLRRIGDKLEKFK